MLKPTDKLTLFMHEALTEGVGKMGHGILRYSDNPVACVIDRSQAGKRVCDVTDIDSDAPIVATIEEALAYDPDVMVLGIAPPGGLIPEQWFTEIDFAVEKGLSLMNGLHNLLEDRYPNLPDGQWVWDIRTEPEGIGVGYGEARHLTNQRVLLIGTDMAVGKMTAGLEIVKQAKAAGVDAEFVATGQVGIAITGKGIPLDRIRIDFAAGAVEDAVLKADAEMVIVEGQGSLLHPGSSSTLPLMRGSQPTELLLCHRAGMDTLPKVPWIKVPPLPDVIKLFEDVCAACGTFRPAPVVGVALNTAHLDANTANDEGKKLEDELQLPVCDPVRDGAGKLLNALQR